MSLTTLGIFAPLFGTLVAAFNQPKCIIEPSYLDDVVLAGDGQHIIEGPLFKVENCLEFVY